MGMSAEQFFQVVLLPQGQFARFLHADADERRVLLQRLFRTGRFRAVEDWLAERRRATQNRVQEADQALVTLAARIAQVGRRPRAGGARGAQGGARSLGSPAEGAWGTAEGAWRAAGSRGKCPAGTPARS